MIKPELLKLVEPEGVSDLVFNGFDCVFQNIKGSWYPVTTVFRSDTELQDFAVELANAVRRRLDFASPFADVAIGNLRFHLSLPLSANQRPTISIRKHQSNRKPLSDILENPGRWQAILSGLVQAKANFIICGGTGSGKTTLLRALMELAAEDRIVTVEDVAELELGVPNLVALQTRPANTDGAGSIDLQKLVLESLRMKPDRIVVGEVRGPELVPMLQALNSGHRGSATTIHANKADDVPARLIGLGLVGGLSPATTAHLAASSFNYVISLGTRTAGINVVSIAKFELTNETKLVTKIEY